MAFSVLSCVVPETIITEKRCVEKTWPNWWDDLSRIVRVFNLPSTSRSYFLHNRSVSLLKASIWPN